MKERLFSVSLFGLVALVAYDPGGEAVSLSPEGWPKGELETYLELGSARQTQPTRGGGGQQDDRGHYDRDVRARRLRGLVAGLVRPWTP